MIGILVAAAVFLSLVAARAAVRAGRRAAVARRLPHAPAGPAGRPSLPPPPAWLATRLEETGVELPADAAFAGWLVAVVVALAGGLVIGGPGLAALGAAAAAAAPLVGWRALRTRGAARYEAALPGALDAIARALRSGGSLRQAIGEAADAVGGRVGADLAGVSGAAAAGSSLVDALDGWGAARPLPSVELVVAALCLGAEAGGAQAQAVDGVAATVRDRLAVAGEVRALSSQARASAWVMAAAPVAFCAFTTATDARNADFLFRTPLGLLFLAAGLGLDAVAALWMARLTRAPE